MADAPNTASLEKAKNTVLVHSEEMSPDARIVRGPDFNKVKTGDELLNSMLDIGFQASEFGRAVQEVNKMLQWRLSQEPLTGEETDAEKEPAYRESVKCTIFLGFTSNMMSCGVRDILRFLAQHRLVDCLVTTCGAVEEDIMKCTKQFYHGDFALSGADLRRKGINRIGNLLVPNNHYCALEDWLQAVIAGMHEEQKTTGKIWSPSSMIDRFGEVLNNEESVWYWCHKNKIPVFCPGITDGAVGDNIFFHSFKSPGFICDTAQDVGKMNNIVINAKKTGAVILGGGLVKHHILNANLMRNGLDYSVFVNTGQEFDGSDAGARPDEAISWGKLNIDSKPVKVYADASLVFPMLAYQTFAKHVHAQQ